MSGKHRLAPTLAASSLTRFDVRSPNGERSCRVFDNIERDALREEGFDPDDPETVTAIDLVRWELSLLRRPDSEVEQG